MFLYNTPDKPKENYKEEKKELIIWLGAPIQMHCTINRSWDDAFYDYGISLIYYVPHESSSHHTTCPRKHNQSYWAQTISESGFFPVNNFPCICYFKQIFC